MSNELCGQGSFGIFVRDKSLAQGMEALRADCAESASADFHELRQEFIPRRVMAKGKSND